MAIPLLTSAVLGLLHFLDPVTQAEPHNGHCSPDSNPAPAQTRPHTIVTGWNSRGPGFSYLSAFFLPLSFPPPLRNPTKLLGFKSPQLEFSLCESERQLEGLCIALPAGCVQEGEGARVWRASAQEQRGTASWRQDQGLGRNPFSAPNLCAPYHLSGSCPGTFAARRGWVSSLYSCSEPPSATPTPCLTPGAQHPQGKIIQFPHFTNDEGNVCFVSFCVL